MGDWWQTAFGSNYSHLYQNIQSQTTPKIVSFLLSILPKGRVLDLGCGDGRITKELLKAGYEAIGVDYSADMLAQAGEGPYVQGDMRELDVSEQFDSVISIFTSFGYFDDREDDKRVVANVYRALKPGGVFVLDLTPTKSDDEFVTIKHEDGDTVIEGRYRQYSENAARSLLKEAGFNEPNVYWRYSTQILAQEPKRMILVAQKHG